MATETLTSDERTAMIHSAQATLSDYGAYHVTATAQMFERKAQEATTAGDTVRAGRMSESATIFNAAAGEAIR